MKQIIIYPKCHKSGNRLKVSVYLCVGVKQMDKTFCVCMCVCERERKREISCFNHLLVFVTLWTVARQSPLSLGFSRQEYWSGLPCPPPEDLSDPGIKIVSLFVSCIWKRFLYQPLRLGSQRRPLKDFKSQI